MTWFASEKLLRQRIGCILHPLVNPATVWQNDQGWKYRMTSEKADELKPTFTEITPIPEPKQRGRAVPLDWRNGAWYKATARGLVKVV